MTEYYENFKCGHRRKMRVEGNTVYSSIYCHKCSPVVFVESYKGNILLTPQDMKNFIEKMSKPNPITDALKELIYKGTVEQDGS